MKWVADMAELDLETAQVALVALLEPILLTMLHARAHSEN